MKKTKENRNLIIGLYIFSVAFICFIVLRNLDALNTITIISDEFGYWYAGSVFAGRDWREVAYLNAYYGFGYGFLLCPLFWIFQNNAVAMYQTAIGYNAIFLIISFFIGIKVMEKLEIELRKEWKILISLAVNVYSNLVYQSQTTQVECLLSCLFWLSLYCLINVMQKHRYRDYVCMALSLAYMYAVHMRTIGVVLSGTIVIILMTWVQKARWKKTFVYLGVLLLLVLGVEGIKTELKDYTYAPLSEYKSDAELKMDAVNIAEIENKTNEVSTMVHSNDYSGVMANVKALFSIEGIRKLFIGIVGKIYYLFAATLFLAFYACGFLGKSLKSGLKNIREEKPDSMFWVSIYLVVNLLLAIGISCVFLLNYNRQDIIVYGRYTEHIIGPILMLGLWLLCDKKISIKTFYAGCVLEVVMGIIINREIVAGGFKQYLDNNAVGLVSKIINIYGDVGNPQFTIAILGFVFFEAFLILLFYKNGKQWAVVVASIICVTVWVVGGDAVYAHNTAQHHGRLAKTIAIGQYLNENARNDNVYYVNEEVAYTVIDYVQFQMPKHSIKVVDTDDIQGSLKKGYYLVKKGSDILANYDVSYIAECRNFTLYYFE